MTNKIEKIRRQIDSNDQKLLKVLAKRFALVKKLQPHKPKGSIEDPAREKELLTKWLQIARVLNISPELTSQILTAILSESKKIQQK